MRRCQTAAVTSIWTAVRGTLQLIRSPQEGRVFPLVIRNSHINTYTLIVEFRWNAWNVNHIAEHGVMPPEAEHVVRFTRRRRKHRKGSWEVIGRGFSNRRMRVVYIIDPDGTFYIIHAMPFR